ncbi:hypothetical protein BH23BAC2_BH23BAC2_21260 [soil metagenome]
MKKSISLLILIFVSLISCNSSTKTKSIMADENTLPGQNKDTTPKVTGIGGIFFFSEDPVEARKWNAENPGLAVNEYGSSFEFRNANRPEEINYL